MIRKSSCCRADSVSHKYDLELNVMVKHGTASVLPPALRRGFWAATFRANQHSVWSV